MSKGPLNFGALMTPSSMFGSMGNNQMINSLSNANAIAAAQAQQAASSMQPQGSGVTDMSNVNGVANQQVKTPPSIFNPSSQAAAMGMFGGSGLMKKEKEPAMDPCSEEFDYDVAIDSGMTTKQIREARKKCKDNSETEESSAKRDESMSRSAQGENN